jgi:hypothetical protein
MARIEERFGGDAADRDADPTDAIALDERDARSLDACMERRDVATGATTENGDVVWRHVLETNGVRRAMFALLLVFAVLVAAQPALALGCTQQNATELKQRGDVAATGVVDFGWSVPFGFVFAADRVYKGDLPAHVLVLGEFRPSDLGGTQHFVAMRLRVPGVYSMDVCDGRLLPDASLGSLGEGRPPSPDLPLSQAGAAVVVGVLVLLLLLRARHGRGNPPTFAAATP